MFDTKKIVALVLVGVLILGGIYYWLSHNLSVSNAEITFVFLDLSSIDSLQEKAFLERTVATFANLEGMDIRISGEFGKKFQTQNIKPIGIADTKELEKKIRGEFDKEWRANKGNAISEEQTIIRCKELIRLASQPKNLDTTKFFVLVGSFPECLSDKGVQVLRSYISSMKTKIPNSILWAVVDTRERKEASIFDSLKVKMENNTLLDNRINLPVSRKCSQSSSTVETPETAIQTVHILGFAPLQVAELSDFSKFLTKQFGSSVNLSFITDSSDNGKMLFLTTINETNLKPLTQLPNGKWNSIGYLMKSMTTLCTKMSDSTEVNVVMVGAIPTLPASVTKNSRKYSGLFVDKLDWDKFSKKPKLKFYSYYGHPHKLSEFEKEFIEVFKYYKISYEVVL